MGPAGGGNAKAADKYLARWDSRDMPEPDSADQSKVRWSDGLHRWWVETPQKFDDLDTQRRCPLEKVTASNKL